MQKVSGAKILTKMLLHHDVTTIFGIPGGNILPVYDAIYESPIKHILASHEQGACFMAQGMSRSTHNPAVCMATSGPGATNMITAVSDAFSDSVPIIIITGQVPTNLRNTSAFQEVDISNMVQKITKRYYYIDNIEKLAVTINEAFILATNGRPGPVWIDLPKDIQIAETFFEPFDSIRLIETEIHDIQNSINQLNNLLQTAVKPVVIAGHGVIISKTEKYLCEFTEKTGIPVVTTLHGITSMDNNHPLYYGMAGMHGSVITNNLLNNADLILALGIRFDDRLTCNINKFCPNAKIIHIDINSPELNRVKKITLKIKGDLKEWLPILAQTAIKTDHKHTISEIYRNNSQEDNYFSPSQWIKSYAASLPANVIITTDVGLHQMWVARYFPFKSSDLFITSGGQGTMGFGLPAAIGAATANKDKQVICFTGDGSLLMNIQELATLAELRLNITIVVMNNAGLGMVRQQQKLFYKQHYSASHYNKAIDFAAIASAFGIKAIKSSINHKENIKELTGNNKPFLIDLQIDADKMIWPMVTPGESIDSMINPSLIHTEIK